MKRERADVVPSAEGTQPRGEREEQVLNLRRHLISSLRDQVSNGSSSYQELVQEVHVLFHRVATVDSPVEQRKLQILLSSLAGCASEVFPKHHNALCSEILDTQFNTQPMGVQEVLVNVFLNWMLANCSLIPGCLSSLAISLVPFKPCVPIKDPLVKWTMPESLLDIHRRILDLVDQVYGMIPQIASQFLGSLFAKQPFWMRPCESHCLYLSAIFEIMKRPVGTHFQEKLWSMVLHHLLDLDVNIQSKDLDRSSYLSGDAEERSLFHCDLGDGSKKSATIDPQARQVTNLLTAMDATMELTFEELENCVSIQNQDQIWRIMMKLLDALLITTHEAQFAHFLIFYLVQKNPGEWTECLARKCLARVEDNWAAAPLRCAYASYIASFLSRAKFVHHELRVKGLETLLITCEAYARKQAEKTRELEMHSQNQRSAGQNPSFVSSLVKHEVFYTCMQSLLYLLCYTIPLQLQKGSNRHTTMRYDQLKALVQGRLSPLLYHPLDPLNHIHPSIAVQFADLVEQLSIIQCQHLIDMAQLYHVKGKLRAYFPFDPYCLGRSNFYLKLEEAFITWSEVKNYLPSQDMEIEGRILSKSIARFKALRSVYSGVDEDKLMEGLSLEDDFTPGSSLPFYNSAGSSLRSD